MNPTISFLGISSIIIIRIITTIGLPPQVWTRFVVPCLSAWCLCDYNNLRRAVDVHLSRPRMRIAVVGVPLLYSGWLPWNLIIPLFCVFCLVTAFSFEKMMYMGSYCGERAKWVCWLAAGSFASETFRMNWKGDWAYCSPYSRRLQRKHVDFYYSLKLPEEHEVRIPEPFHLEFMVEKCKIRCKYSDCDETLGSPESSSLWTASVEEASDEANQEQQAGARPKNRRSSFGTAGGSGAVSDESTSSQSEHLTKDRYVFRKAQVSKLEVSLFLIQGDKEVPLECYTYFQRKPDGIVEMKRAMEVLKDEGNVIFSSFYRNLGSSVHKAHAKCYEFAEMCDLILNHGCILRKVSLLDSHECDISGSAVLAVVNVAFFLWINYLQLSSTSKPELIPLLVFSGLLQLVFGLHLEKKLFCSRWGKKLIFLFISSTTEPHQLNLVYRYFQVKLPFLTFCNESYGYPLQQNCRSICSFPDMRLPLTDIIETPLYLQLELPLARAQRFFFFDLKAMDLELTVRGIERDSEFEVQVLMRRKYDREHIYYNKFRINEERKVANLVALLRWLVENNCVGVCKDWPKRTLMHAYRYEELLCKVLQEGAQPWIIYWSHSIDVCVEGLLV